MCRIPGLLPPKINYITFSQNHVIIIPAILTTFVSIVASIIIHELWKHYNLAQILKRYFYWLP